MAVETVACLAFRSILISTCCQTFAITKKNAMLLDFHLHLHTDLMLRYCIRSSLALAYGNIRSSIAFAHWFAATLSNLLLQLGCGFLLACTPAWCYVVRSSLALAHRIDATLSNLLLCLHTDAMLRYQMLPCSWCGVGWGGVGRTSEENDILVPLRYQIFPCTCTPICELMLRWQIFSCCDIGRQICEKKIRFTVSKKMSKSVPQL